MSDICMPSLGADMIHGTLVAWHVKPGDQVARGDVVAEVETQKGAFSVDAREPGVVDTLLVEPGARVPVGEPLLRLRGAGQVVEAVAVPAVPVAAAVASEAPARAAPAPSTEPAPPRRRVTPLARRLATELHVDLDAVTGTGDHAAVTKEDVEHAAAARQGAEFVSPGEGQSGMRAAIAAAMARSKREIPHYYLAHDLDMDAAMGWLRETNAQREVPRRLLISTLLLKATARAAREFGEFNGHFVAGAFAPATGVHPGVAITLRGGGLVAPALHDADTLGLDALNGALLDLVRRARQGRLMTSEVSDPTLTVTMLGDQGVQSVVGVIYPPQVAIVGFGTVSERPWAVDGMLGVRPVVTVTLAADHRVSDGHRGALFLRAIDTHLQHPEAL